MNPRHWLVLPLLWVAVLLASPALASAVEECDRLAAHPRDPQRQAEGVSLDDIPLPGALDACRQAAEEEPGNLRIAYQYGRTLIKAKRDAEGVDWFRKAAESGYPQAFLGLGILEGMKNPPDHDKALEYFSAAADKGHTVGLLMIGFAYESGKGVSMDVGKALNYFRRAAELGSPDGQFLVGMIYFEGQGVIRDPQEASKWFSLAKDSDPLSMLMLGYMHLHGMGVAKDDAKTFELYLKAAQLGEPAGMARVGELYLYGWGVDRNAEEAIQWLRQAVKKGDPYGTALLGFTLLGREGDKEANREGLRILVEAAESGNADAADKLWSAYYYGYGVEEDERKSQFWMNETRRLRGGRTPPGGAPPIMRGKPIG
jgi:TPR repeat protein